VLAADEKVAAGLLIQRLPVKGEANLEGRSTGGRDAPHEDQIGHNEDYNRISILASSLTRDELLTLDVDTILHRLFWEEPLRVFEPQTPTFSCSCSADRVRNMLRNLGREEAQSILDERGDIEIGCDFCGTQYRFDAVDVGALFAPSTSQADASPNVH